jgi:hypothetical protein
VDLYLVVSHKKKFIIGTNMDNYGQNNILVTNLDYKKKSRLHNYLIKLLLLYKYLIKIFLSSNKF